MARRRMDGGSLGWLGRESFSSLPVNQVRRYSLPLHPPFLPSTSPLPIEVPELPFLLSNPHCTPFSEPNNVYLFRLSPDPFLFYSFIRSVIGSLPLLPFAPCFTPFLGFSLLSVFFHYFLLFCLSFSCIISPTAAYFPQSVASLPLHCLTPFPQSSLTTFFLSLLCPFR